MDSLLTTKQIGIAMVAFAVMIFFILLSLTENIRELNTLVCKNYTLPPTVFSLVNNIPIPVVFGMIVDISLGLLGTFLIFTEKHTHRIESEKQEKWKKIIKELSGEDKLLYEIIGNAGGLIYQNELVQKSAMNKVRVTRILDKLEAKGLIERKRRGMTNIVTLRYG